MDEEFLKRRRAERALARRRRHRRRRVTALSGLLVIATVVVVMVLAPWNGSSTPRGTDASATSHPATARSRPTRTTATVLGLGPATGHPGHAEAPILMYHVINPPPPGAPYPGLYVTASEFASQMKALRAAGYVGVTLNELEANWTRGARLPKGKPVVITFDNGYRSQYTNALPVLRALRWPADENLQLSGLPPDQGGLTHAQVHGLIEAGWELDTQGISHADLVDLDAGELHDQIFSARRRLRREYHVPVRWFCYPSGQYDATVIAAVQSAGFIGSTTVVPGWAQAADDRFELPRLRVLGGTTAPQLLAQIADTRDAAAPPSSYTTSS